MAAQEHSDAVQDYVREIFKLHRRDGRATTNALAEAMGVSPSSATAMMKKLAAAGLVEYAPYRGVKLTETGEQIALEMTRHHRLLEQYLAQRLDLSIDEVHVEADLLEHAPLREARAADRCVARPSQPRSPRRPDPRSEARPEQRRPSPALDARGRRRGGGRARLRR